jgi:hypothetical protein
MATQDANFTLFYLILQLHQTTATRPDFLLPNLSVPARKKEILSE